MRNDLGSLEMTVRTEFLFGREYTDLHSRRYDRFSFPSFPALMDFRVRRSCVYGFGNMMTMHTQTPFGMEMLTCAFTPYEGGDVPFFLIDIVLSKGKQTVFTEYYDCTVSKKPHPLLSEVYDKYRDIPPYDERPAWYVGERAEYSLIKAVPEGEDISGIITDSVRAYRDEALSAGKDRRNLKGLCAFRSRMTEEGNPSLPVLRLVFGRDGAKRFFNRCVMPMRAK